MKRPHKKVDVDPLAQGDSPLSKPKDFQPGFRPDNAWHLYDSDNLPDTKEKWENLTVVEKTHWGYYTWPKWVIYGIYSFNFKDFYSIFEDCNKYEKNSLHKLFKMLEPDCLLYV